MPFVLEFHLLPILWLHKETSPYTKVGANTAGNLAVV